MSFQGDIFLPFTLVLFCVLNFRQVGGADRFGIARRTTSLFKAFHNIKCGCRCVTKKVSLFHILLCLVYESKILYLSVFSSTPIAKGGMKTTAKNGLRTNVRLSHPNNVDFAPKRSVKTSQSCSAPPNRFAALGQEDIANERQNVSAKLSR